MNPHIACLAYPSHPKEHRNDCPISAKAIDSNPEAFSLTSGDKLGIAHTDEGSAMAKLQLPSPSHASVRLSDVYALAKWIKTNGTIAPSQGESLHETAAFADRASLRVI